MKEKSIKEIIDTYLKKWVDAGINNHPIPIEDEMADPLQDKTEEWRTWFPITSSVTDFEIEDFEKQIGRMLPEDYKILLKHKHFYDLHISEASFCAHPIHTWKARQVEFIFNGYPKEFLIEKGFMPFADWSDWGLLCFDTNRNKENSNYPIVLWDHEISDEVQDQYKDFYDLLIKLDLQDKQENG